MANPEGSFSLPEVMHHWAEPFRQHPDDPIARSVARSLEELATDAFTMRTALTQREFNRGTTIEAMRVVGFNDGDVIGYTLTSGDLSGEDEQSMRALVRSMIGQIPKLDLTEQQERAALALAVRANLHTVAALAVARVKGESKRKIYYSVFYPDAFMDFDPMMRMLGMGADSAFSLANHFLKQTPSDTAATLNFSNPRDPEH